jgi:hypothetical protein
MWKTIGSEEVKDGFYRNLPTEHHTSLSRKYMKEVFYGMYGHHMPDNKYLWERRCIIVVGKWELRSKEETVSIVCNFISPYLMSILTNYHLNTLLNETKTDPKKLDLMIKKHMIERGNYVSDKGYVSGKYAALAFDLCHKKAGGIKAVGIGGSILYFYLYKEGKYAKMVMTRDSATALATFMPKGYIAITGTRGSLMSIVMDRTVFKIPEKRPTLVISFFSRLRYDGKPTRVSELFTALRISINNMMYDKESSRMFVNSLAMYSDMTASI